MVGIGLALVQQLVQAMGARVTVPPGPSSYVSVRPTTGLTLSFEVFHF